MSQLTLPLKIKVLLRLREERGNAVIRILISIEFSRICFASTLKKEKKNSSI